MERDRGGDYLLRPVDGGDDVLVADDLMPDCMPTLKVAKIAIHREILITICSHKLSVHCLKTLKQASTEPINIFIINEMNIKKASFTENKNMGNYWEAISNCMMTHSARYSGL